MEIESEAKMEIKKEKLLMENMLIEINFKYISIPKK